MLTPDQQTVANILLTKLFEGKPQEMIISGPAGTGKSYLINYLLHDIIERYTKTVVVCGGKPLFVDNPPRVTATTNKAVGVLENSIQNYYYPIETIESALGLIVKNDYKSGKTILTPGPNGLYIHTDTIFIIDEASMIDKQLYGFIHKCCINCFIIFIGDDCQLPAVKEGNIPLIWQLGLPEYKLTTIVRQADNQEVADLANETRDTVITGAFKDIHTNNSIHKIIEPELKKAFLYQMQPNDKILTYTNMKAIQYNDWIMKEIHGYEAASSIYAGETYITNNFFKTSDIAIPAETEITVQSIEETVVAEFNHEPCTFLRLKITPGNGQSYTVCVPHDKEFFKRWLQFIARTKDWSTYFAYKDSVMDLRGNYASTIHKAQGSTFDKVIIDAKDFKSCTNPAIAARLLYVAVSRAKHGITFFGDLPKKYGRIW